ncbi:MAG: hypothetical protein AAF267_17640 [Deinococcota bacterium]
MDETLYAEDMNYYKTGKQNPETILQEVVAMIENAGGAVTHYAFLYQNGQDFVIMQWEFGNTQFRKHYPVLPQKTPSKSILAAKRQAVTALKHYVKSRVLDVRYDGFEAAFAGSAVYQGRTVEELVASGGMLALTDGVVDIGVSE